MVLISILVFIFGCMVGGFISDMILGDRYDKELGDTHQNFQEARIHNLKQLYCHKRLTLSYIRAMETIWVPYMRMLEGYKTITSIFETLDKHSGMTNEDKSKLLENIRSIAQARYNETKDTGKAYAKLLGINMDEVNIWDDESDFSDIIPCGEDHRLMEEGIRKMQDEIHDIDEETEEMEEVK